MVRKRRFTLMPIITLASLSLVVAVPMFSSTRLYAASAQHFATVTVRPGDTLWSIASGHTSGAADVADAVDQIVEINHLGGSSIHPGEKIKIPV